ncbi:MAG: 5-(carboxyamino)imidazole ribonucleotide synthase, partial [Pseudomonadota bacterium]
MTAELAQPVGPGGVVGVLGGGQLARMLCLAAAKIGLRAWVLDPEARCPAADCAAGHIEAHYDDRAGLQRLAEVADVVTYEFENVPAESAAWLTEFGAPAAPGPQILEIAQDRVTEKTFVRDHGGATADFAPVESEADLAAALTRIGAPALLKT